MGAHPCTSRVMKHSALLCIALFATALAGCDRRESDGQSTTPPASGAASQPPDTTTPPPASDATGRDSTAPAAANPPETQPDTPREDEDQRR
jgi:hypothetical protein